MAANIKHPELLQPENDVYIWKYLSLQQFLYLIRNNFLWFSRLDKLGDAFEGTTPINHDNYIEINSKKGKNIIKNAVFDNMISYQRLALFVNCWHENDNESMAMWKIYGKNELSVAIKIKYSKLVSLLPDGVIIGKVKYKNYDKYEYSKNVLSYATTKREAFIYENEIRALFFNIEQLPKLIFDQGFDQTNISNIPYGINIKINRDILLEEIILNPEFPDWFIDTFNDICTKYNINPSNIHASGLDARIINLRK